MSTSRSALTILGSAALVAASFAPAITANDEGGSFDLDTQLTDFVGRARGGAVALTSRDGVVTSSAAGIANKDGDAMTVGTPMRIAGASSPFIATMVLQLVDEGLVDLDAPLSTYLPDTSAGADATVRSLLSMHSGIPDISMELTLAALDDASRAWALEDAISLLDEAAWTMAAGTFVRSPANYVFLKQLVAAVDGTDFESAFERRISSPLGLDDTVFPSADTAAPAGLAAGWMFDFGFDGDPDIEVTAMNTTSGPTSSVADIQTFLAALNDGQLISDQLMGQMFDPEADAFSFGFATPEKMFGAAGVQGGYFGADGIHPLGFWATFGVDPESGDMLVVLTNNIDLAAPELAQNIVNAWAPKG